MASTIGKFNSRLKRLVIALFSFTMGIAGCSSEAQISDDLLLQVYNTKLAPPQKKLKVLYIGHSLVGREIPDMVRQLAGEGHEYASQLGWGTKLRAHWEPETKIKGFEFVSSFVTFENAREAIESGVFDTFVLTEGVEIKDAIKYHDCPKYLTNFVRHIHEYNPESRIFLYETWHNIDDPEGWLFRIERDYKKYWLGNILDKSLITTEGKIPVYIIPAGQVMKAFFDNLGSFPDSITPEDFAHLFKIKEGKQDKIHLNHIGAYMISLVHYSTLYQVPTTGKPYQLSLRNGDPAVSPSKELAEYMQEISWKVISQSFRTGAMVFNSEGVATAPTTQ